MIIKLTPAEVKNFVGLARIAAFGSVAAPGFRDPEGIVIYHTAAGVCFKKTIKDDETPKSLVDNS